MSEKNCPSGPELSDFRFELDSGGHSGSYLFPAEKALWEATQAAIAMSSNNISPHIPPVGGSAEAVKCAVPNISPEGAAALGNWIDAGKAKPLYKEGEALQLPSTGELMERSFDMQFAIWRQQHFFK